MDISIACSNDGKGVDFVNGCNGKSSMLTGTFLNTCLLNGLAYGDILVWIRIWWLGKWLSNTKSRSPG